MILCSEQKMRDLGFFPSLKSLPQDFQIV